MFTIKEKHYSFYSTRALNIFKGSHAFGFPCYSLYCAASYMSLSLHPSLTMPLSKRGTWGEFLKWKTLARSQIASVKKSFCYFLVNTNIEGLITITSGKENGAKCSAQGKVEGNLVSTFLFLSYLTFQS